MALTNNDLVQYERPARIYCAKVGLNADDMVLVSGTSIIAAANTRPRWMNVAEQMIHLSLMMVSMRESIGIDQGFAGH